ncbi:hypothetical protein [Kamptonema sp. UHCC 0994]|uniref:hypothetical protein n=1 Tax=Kamptonema sp. UHCC 0994 TaxID=3031329 RepID=UPI0023B9D44A|nr:hypothetical protein [Kamptonema sp. UHCC 0994]MDF0553718.1 hypothetical protein [Kamptonema sp. UHCC 0994]
MGEAQKLLCENLTAQIWEKEAIEKWNGTLPLVIGDSSTNLLDLTKFINGSNSSIPQ